MSSIDDAIKMRRKIADIIEVGIESGGLSFAQQAEIQRLIQQIHNTRERVVKVKKHEAFCAYFGKDHDGTCNPQTIELHGNELIGGTSRMPYDVSSGLSEPSIEPKDDEVNHPTHYTSHPSGVECIAVTQWMSFCLGNAIKYIWRSGEKDKAKTITDLEKAVWYIQCEIKRLA